MKTFAIESSSQFRADGPPDVTSAQWADDLNETKAYGALSGSLRTPGQTAIARFHAACHLFARTQDIVKEVIDARIYGGTHYRTSGVHGTVIASKVARAPRLHRYSLPDPAGR
ncbi:MAG TPA: hypothetical protein VFV95_06685 [Vicinamibacterales bacterium]|nr:hypothetical protein [Vicinamibacterales bacterium]